VSTITFAKKTLVGEEDRRSEQLLDNLCLGNAITFFGSIEQPVDANRVRKILSLMH
jgi:hypothetical protein